MLHRLGAFGWSRFGNQARAGLRSQNKKVCSSFVSSKLSSRQASTTRSFLGTSDRALFLGHGKHFGLLRTPNALGSLRCFGVATALHFPLFKHAYSGNKSVSSDLFVGQNAWNEKILLQYKSGIFPSRTEEESEKDGAKEDKQHTPTRRTTIGFVDDLLGVAPYLVWKPAEKPREGVVSTGK